MDNFQICSLADVVETKISVQIFLAIRLESSCLAPVSAVNEQCCQMWLKFIYVIIKVTKKIFLLTSLSSKLLFQNTFLHLNALKTRLPLLIVVLNASNVTSYVCEALNGEMRNTTSNVRPRLALDD